MAKMNQPSQSMIRKIAAGMEIEQLDPKMVEVLRGKTEAERLKIGWGMWRSARRMMTRILQSEYPEWSKQQVQAEVARRMSHGT